MLYECTMYVVMVRPSAVLNLFFRDIQREYSIVHLFMQGFVTHTYISKILFFLYASSLFLCFFIGDICVRVCDAAVVHIRYMCLWMCQCARHATSIDFLVNIQWSLSWRDTISKFYAHPIRHNAHTRIREGFASIIYFHKQQVIKWIILCLLFNVLLVGWRSGYPMAISAIALRLWQYVCHACNYNLQQLCRTIHSSRHRAASGNDASTIRKVSVIQACHIFVQPPPILRHSRIYTHIRHHSKLIY